MTTDQIPRSRMDLGIPARTRTYDPDLFTKTQRGTGRTYKRDAAEPLWPGRKPAVIPDLDFAMMSVPNPLQGEHQRCFPVTACSVLKITNLDGTEGFANTFMGSESHLVSSAHCVRGFGPRGEWNPELIVYPGAHRSTKPYGAHRVTRAFVHPSWVAGDKSAVDIALLCLDSEVGLRSGFLKLASLPDSELVNRRLYRLSIGLEEWGFQPWFSLFDRTMVTPKSLSAVGQAVNGESGSLVFGDHPEHGVIALGVLAGTWRGGKHGTVYAERFTPRVLHWLAEAMAEPC